MPPSYSLALWASNAAADGTTTLGAVLPYDFRHVVSELHPGRWHSGGKQRPNQLCGGGVGRQDGL